MVFTHVIKRGRRKVSYLLDIRGLERNVEAVGSFGEQTKSDVNEVSFVPVHPSLPLTRSVADGGGNGSGPFERLTDCPTKHGGSTKLALDDDRPIRIILFMWQFFGFLRNSSFTELCDLSDYVGSGSYYRTLQLVWSE